MRGIITKYVALIITGLALAGVTWWADERYSEPWLNAAQRALGVSLAVVTGVSWVRWGTRQ